MALSTSTQADAAVGTEEQTLRYGEALNEALREEMRRDVSVFTLGVGIAERGGSYKVTADLLEEFGPKRVFDTPIAEPGITGIGIGSALVGMRPVVEILFVDFTMLVMDQLVNQAAKIRFMTGDQCAVPMVLRTQGGSGNCVAAQHSQSLEALFYHIPGLKVAVPSIPADAKGLLKTAIRDDEPVIFLEHKLLYGAEGPVPSGDITIPFGEARIHREGSDLTLVAWSNMIPRSLEVADVLAEEGISVEVIDPRTLVPLDKSAILESVCRTGRLLIVQEAVRRGGVASDIASIVQREVFDYLDAPIEILGGANTPIPYNRELEYACIPQIEQILDICRRLVSGKI